MTSPIPERRVEPLPPPPGAFDSVVSQARTRRHRRLTTVTTVTGVFLAGVFGGVGLAGGVTGVQQRLASVVNSGQLTGSSPSASSASTKASRVPNRAKHRRPSPAPSTAPVPPAPHPVHAALVRGRVVDPSGAPVVGMYVWTGRSTRAGFVPTATPAAVTGRAGRFAVPCTRGPVLLTSWPLGVGLGAEPEGRWAATFVTQARCSRSGTPRVTTVSAGAVVAGTVRTDVPCPGVEFSVPVRLGGVRTPVRLAGLTEGGQFRLSGVPGGVSVLGDRAHGTSVRLAAGTSVQRDVTFSCPAAPTPSDTPTDTTSPSPQSPSPSPSPPTSSPTVSDPTPSPSSPTPTIGTTG